MTRVLWTRPAREDLQEIREFIARDSPHYARLTVTRLVRAVGRLRDHPLSGRIVPELGRSTIREVIKGNFRIVYRVGPETVEILAVVHAAQDFPNAG